MPEKKVDRDVVSAITKLILGMPKEKVAEETGLAESTVDLIIRYLKKGFGKDLYRGVMKTFRTAEKKSIPFESVEMSYRLGQKTGQLGIDIEEMISWLNDVFKAARKHKMNPAKLVELLYSQHALLKDEDPRKLPDKIKEMQEYDKQVVERGSIDALLQENNLTRQMLQEFIEANKQLAPYGLSASNIPKMAQVMKNLEGEGYDPQQIIGKLQQENYFADQYEQWGKRIGGLKDQFKEQEQKLGHVREHIEDEQLGYDEYIKTRKAGFDAHKLRLLRDKVSGIMKISGMDETKAVEKLVSDISNQYDEKIGFELTVQKTAEKNRMLLKEKERLEKSIAELGEEEVKLDRVNAEVVDKISHGLQEIQHNLSGMPKTAQDIVQVLEKARNDLMEVQKQTLASTLPIENLSPIGKLMRGEKVELVLVLGATDQIVKVIEERTPQNLSSSIYIREIRKSIRGAAMVPLGQSILI